MILPLTKANTEPAQTAPTDSAARHHTEPAGIGQPNNADTRLARAAANHTATGRHDNRAGIRRPDAEVDL